ncbi:MAG: SGNH/GDSL hydrolase family protein [Chthoniobacteraceae bacterium]
MANPLSAKYAFVLVSILSLGGFALRAVEPAPLPQEIPPQNPNIRYIGRWDMSDPAAPKATWTDSTVTVDFKGTSLNAKLKYTGNYPASYYQITVDGQPTVSISPKPGEELFAVAAGLPDKEHTIEIIRRDEAAWAAPFVFEGFQLEKEGKLMPLPPRSEKRLLIIGDSISCGYGNEAAGNEHNPHDKQNGYMTYGAIAGRKLGAEVEIIAWSGRTLFPSNTMVELYDRTLAQSPTPKADLKSWVPQVVLIDLGTNDFRNPKQPPNQAGWIGAYKSFISTIRQTAPNAYIFVASGPMGTPANWDQWARIVVSDLNAMGDKNLSYLPFPNQDINADGKGGDWHPSVKTHIKMADRLVGEIEKATGWKALAGAQ